MDNIIESLLPVIIGTDKNEVEYWRTVWSGYNADNIHHPMTAMISRADVEESKISSRALVIHGSDYVGIPLDAGIALNNALSDSQLYQSGKLTGQVDPLSRTYF